MRKISRFLKGLSKHWAVIVNNFYYLSTPRRRSLGFISPSLIKSFWDLSILRRDGCLSFCFPQLKNNKKYCFSCFRMDFTDKLEVYSPSWKIIKKYCFSFPVGFTEKTNWLKPIYAVMIQIDLLHLAISCARVITYIFFSKHTKIGMEFFWYFIQHCFICRPSSTVSEDAGTEPWGQILVPDLPVQQPLCYSRLHPQVRD